ncbi:MAG: 4-hydroxy-tetrahydrodipicolinate reductase, partial [Oscillospiraceae bacterium]
MVKICISGYLGKMGTAIKSQISTRTDCKVGVSVDCFAKDNDDIVVNSFDNLKDKPDVIIDFSSIEGTKQVIKYCKTNRVPCVICTTGLDDMIEEMLNDLACIVPVFRSANMSIGINLLIELSKIAANILGDNFDVEIVEKHHNRKLDAPSGTALMIADEMNDAENGKYEYVYDRHCERKARSKNEIGIHSVRGGTIVGEHEVIFAG